jgi:hypothetical protein
MFVTIFAGDERVVFPPNIQQIQGIGKLFAL